MFSKPVEIPVNFAPSVAVIFALNVVACTQADEPTFELSGHAQPVRVQAGQPFRIKVSAQLGAGYSWRLRAPVPEFVKQLGSSVESPGSNMVGTEQIQVFSFVITKPGTQKLTFEYGRPFEKQGISDEIRSVTVTAM